MGTLFKGTPKAVQAPASPEVDSVVNRLTSQANNVGEGATQTAGQAQFDFSQNKLLSDVLKNISAQKGARPSQLATLSNNAIANTGAELVGQAAIRDAQERDAANARIADIILQRRAQDIGVSFGNQTNQRESNKSVDQLLGTALTAAGKAGLRDPTDQIV